TGTVSITTQGKTVSVNRVSGHRDVGSTSCPGDLLYSQLATIRSTAASVASQTTPTVPPSSTTTTTTASTPSVPSRPLGLFGSASALVDQSYRDLLRRPPSTNERTVATAAITGGQKAEVFLAALVNGNEMNNSVRQTIRL